MSVPNGSARVYIGAMRNGAGIQDNQISRRGIAHGLPAGVFQRSFYGRAIRL